MHPFLVSLTAAERSTATIQFSPEAPMSTRTFIGRVRCAADYLADSDAQQVGLTLTTDANVMAFALGVWLSGRTLVSLPHGTDFASDEGFGDVFAFSDGGRVHFLGWTEPPSLPADLIQYTSGSTGEPKGVCLTLSALQATIEATLVRLGVAGEQRVVSWLPMSHDMGFVGMFLMPLVYWGSTGSGGSLTLIPPSRFVRRPLEWLAQCSRVGATITTASPTGLRAALEWLERDSARRLDLRPLTSLIVGAELLDPLEIRRAQTVLSSFGAGSTVLTPAFGCAEMGLTVSLGFDESQRGTLVPSVVSYQGVDFVATGAPLPSAKVGLRSSTASVPPEVVLSGQSLMTGYAGDARKCVEFRTGDVATVHASGQLVPLGRREQWIEWNSGAVSIVAFERRAVGHLNVRGARVSAVQAEPGVPPIVIYESKRSADLSVELASLFEQTTGVACGGVIRLNRGEFPVTHSGKVAYGQLSRKVARRS